MNKSEILAFMNANPIFHLATADGNIPHVRGMALYGADENGIIFSTGTQKDLHQQLSANSNVELCFNNYREHIQIRVSGRIENVNDMELKRQIVVKHRFLKPWIEEVGYEKLAVYRLKKGKVTVWTRAANLMPQIYTEF